jgi:hypothetical protein
VPGPRLGQCPPSNPDCRLAEGGVFSCLIPACKSTCYVTAAKEALGHASPTGMQALRHRNARLHKSARNGDESAPQALQSPLDLCARGFLRLVIAASIRLGKRMDDHKDRRVVFSFLDAPHGALCCDAALQNYREARWKAEQQLSSDAHNTCEQLSCWHSLAVSGGRQTHKRLRLLGNSDPLEGRLSSRLLCKLPITGFRR